MCVTVCDCVRAHARACVLFSSLDVLRQAELLYVAYVELMCDAKAWLKLAKRPIPQRLDVINIATLCYIMLHYATLLHMIS